MTLTTRLEFIENLLLLRQSEPPPLRPPKLLFELFRFVPSIFLPDYLFCGLNRALSKSKLSFKTFVGGYRGDGPNAGNASRKISRRAEN